jgi:DNA-binding MarR family transcriptional regulator
MDHYTKESFMLTQSVGFTLTQARNMLTQARNMITAEMDAALKDLDINSQQMGIVLSLNRGVAATAFELSKLLSIDTGLMTRMLDKLEMKGLLERSRSVHDRRVVNLMLTAKGEALAARIPEVAPQVLNAPLKKFTKAEFAELRRLLHKFIGE